MPDKIRVAILDDHQSIVDGYVYRLEKDPFIEVSATGVYGEDLEPMMAAHPSDVLLLDVSVPTSPKNPNPSPILHLIPRLLQNYPNLSVLVISMHAERSLIKAIVDAGASGYILKDDRETLRDLSTAVQVVARGGIHFSQQAYQLLVRNDPHDEDVLSVRQREILSLSAAYPNSTANDLAQMLNVTASTVRNLLSTSYIKLGVNNRTGAIFKARQLGLITPVASLPSSLVNTAPSKTVPA